MNESEWDWFLNVICNDISVIYRISGIFLVGLIFSEFATSLKLPKIDTVKSKSYYRSSLRVPEITKNRTQWKFNTPSVISAKISRREKFPIYGMWRHIDVQAEWRQKKVTAKWTQILAVTLTLEIWPWVKVMPHHWVLDNNCVKYHPNAT